MSIRSNYQNVTCLQLGYCRLCYDVIFFLFLKYYFLFLIDYREVIFMSSSSVFLYLLFCLLYLFTFYLRFFDIGFLSLIHI